MKLLWQNITYMVIVTIRTITKHVFIGLLWQYVQLPNVTGYLFDNFSYCNKVRFSTSDFIRIFPIRSHLRKGTPILEVDSENKLQLSVVSKSEQFFFFWKLVQKQLLILHAKEVIREANLEVSYDYLNPKKWSVGAFFGPFWRLFPIWSNSWLGWFLVSLNQNSSQNCDETIFLGSDSIFTQNLGITRERLLLQARRPRYRVSRRILLMDGRFSQKIFKTPKMSRKRNVQKFPSIFPQNFFQFFQILWKFSEISLLLSLSFLHNFLEFFSKFPHIWNFRTKIHARLLT